MYIHTRRHNRDLSLKLQKHISITVTYLKTERFDCVNFYIIKIHIALKVNRLSILRIFFSKINIRKR